MAGKKQLAGGQKTDRERETRRKRVKNVGEGRGRVDGHFPMHQFAKGPAAEKKRTQTNTQGCCGSQQRRQHSRENTAAGGGRRVMRERSRRGAPKLFKKKGRRFVFWLCGNGDVAAGTQGALEQKSRGVGR